MDELGSFTLIGFSDVSLVFIMVVRDYIYSPVHSDSSNYIFCVWFWWGSSTTIRECLN